jgi:hypothetical protein
LEWTTADYSEEEEGVTEPIWWAPGRITNGKEMVPSRQTRFASARAWRCNEIKRLKSER